MTDAGRAARDYLEQLRNVDVPRVAGSRRDPARVGRLLQSLARNSATEVAVSVLAADAGGAAGQVLHYRDSYGVEVGAIVQLSDGRWAGFEIKLGTGCGYFCADGIAVIPIGALAPWHAAVVTAWWSGPASIR